jgi:ABC-type uncharacterized transport system permease subunit
MVIPGTSDKFVLVVVVYEIVCFVFVCMFLFGFTLLLSLAGVVCFIYCCCFIWGTVLGFELRVSHLQSRHSAI